MVNHCKICCIKVVRKTFKTGPGMSFIQYLSNFSQMPLKKKLCKFALYEIHNITIEQVKLIQIFSEYIGCFYRNSTLYLIGTFMDGFTIITTAEFLNKLSKEGDGLFHVENKRFKLKY